jgi:hypothetical protein
MQGTPPREYLPNFVFGYYSGFGLPDIDLHEALGFLLSAAREP